MKVIDLFSDIANNKPVPNKIKVSNYIYHFDISESSYTRFINNDLENPRGLLEDIDLHNAYVWFNLEVEILEETPEKIDKIEVTATYCGFDNEEENIKKSFDLIHRNENKINELIDKVNYLLEKENK